MAIPKKIQNLVRTRDSYCWHCGIDDDTLVLHHRKGKGMGGSKLLDTPDNLMLVCSSWNGLMESNPVDAMLARGWGHKVPVWGKLEQPVFDRPSFSWWFLLPDGGRLRCDWKDQPF